MTGEVRTAATGEDARSIFAPPLRPTSVGILILITLIAFEEMAVAPALPTVARDLHAIGAYGWAFTGFLVANVVGMVVAGQVSDERGPTAPLAVGMLAFIAGLVIAGTALSMAQLVAGRVVQGLGGGLLMTAMYVVIGQGYPEPTRPKLFAAISSAWVVPSLLGPVVSGAVTQHLGWRWVFLGLLPLVIVGCVLMLPVLRSLRSTPRAPRPVGQSAAAGWAGSCARSRLPRASPCSNRPGSTRRPCWRWRRWRGSPLWCGGCARCCRLAPHGCVRVCPRRWRCVACWPARSSAPSRWCRCR